MHRIILNLRMPKVLLVVTIILSCAACVPQAQYDYDRQEESSLIGRVLGDVEVGDVDILALTPEIEMFLDSKIDGSWGTQKRLQKLRELLYSEDQLNIHYDANDTLTATETFNARAGNCLSLTSLFVAAARHVGLQAKFQKVTVDPTWDHDGNVLIRYEHIVATGHVAGGAAYVIDFLPDFVIGDKRAYIITDEAAEALYYNNLGAEGILDGRNDDAIRYLRIALKLDPQFSNAWNNMGAAMRRAGEYDLAEFSYLTAIRQDKRNYSALGNLSQFYKYRGRDYEAAHYLGRVKSYRDQNPYFHYFLAELSFREGDYNNARQYLNKSIRLKRDDPDFYEALAKTHEKLGNDTKSLQMMVLADKYRSGILQAPVRRMNHRYWSMTINVNPGL